MLAVRPLGNDTPGRVTVVTALHPHGGFRRHINGQWVYAARPREIIRTWPGPWTEIICNWPDANRMIFWDCYENVLSTNALHVWRMPEDGHNEQVVRAAYDRGFTAFAQDGWLELRNASL